MDSGLRGKGMGGNLQTPPAAPVLFVTPLSGEMLFLPTFQIQTVYGIAL